MKVSRAQVLARLRDAGWGFHRRAKRVEIWKKHGSPDRITLPLNDMLDPIFCRAILREVGLRPHQIESFIAACIKN